MSLSAMEQVRTHSKQWGGAYWTLMMLADLAQPNSKGVQTVYGLTLDELVRKVRLSKRAIRGHISKLSRDGEIASDRVIVPHGYLANTYRIILEVLPSHQTISTPPRAKSPPAFNGRKARRALVQRDGVLCSLCHGLLDPFSERVHVDRIVPRVAGGSDALDNLQLVHGECNLWKGAKVPTGA